MWDIIWWVLIVPYVLSCIGLIVIVLLQKGKGVGFAGAFGVGAGSETVFGPRASKSLPQRLTYVMAGVFMALALIMSIIAGRLGKGSAPEKLSEGAAATTTAPATPDVTPGTLDDLGSALKDKAPAAVGEAVPVSVTPPPPQTPAPAPAEAPAAPASAPAEAPAAPAPAPAEAPAPPGSGPPLN
ncbi:MAG: preprotein translocase subunit SecG [Candidatus Hydrogenedentes bacterium]|nr:preprotein translocase subunit SecG [Candidatus Hydrogenedentota bacterium]